MSVYKEITVETFWRMLRQKLFYNIHSLGAEFCTLHPLGTFKCLHKCLVLSNLTNILRKIVSVKSEKSVSFCLKL